MPGGWNFNPWGLNPWGSDPALDAAHSTSRLFGGAAPPRLADVLQPSLPVKDPDDYDPADWFEQLSSDWPSIPNVIPADKQILKKRDTETVKKWVNAHLAPDKQREKPECFHYAKYQMHIMGFGISGPPAIDHDSMLAVYEDPTPGGGRVPVIQLDQAVRAVTYLKRTLPQVTRQSPLGTPVMMGVKLAYYTAEPNNIWGTPYVIPTDHFVVAVGAGVENGRPYVTFYDSLGAYGSWSRLYLTPLMVLEYGDYRMIEMRRSYPR